MLIISKIHLHSTMYLLNHCRSGKTCIWYLEFTFHYVSIKSILSQHTNRMCPKNLHSTMYLLNQISDKSCLGKKADLHSTMYLLNPKRLYFCRVSKGFTFHYVSIKSNHIRYCSRHIIIYIPLCIY